MNISKTTIRFILFVSILCLLLCPPPSLAKIHRLTILHTNNHNGHFAKFSPYGNPDVGGMAARSTLVNIVRAEVEAARQRDGRPRFVAGALGPTNRTASISPDVNDPVRNDPVGQNPHQQEKPDDEDVVAADPQQEKLEPGAPFRIAGRGRGGQLLGIENRQINPDHKREEQNTAHRQTEKGDKPGPKRKRHLTRHQAEPVLIQRSEILFEIIFIELTEVVSVGFVDDVAGHVFHLNDGFVAGFHCGQDKNLKLDQQQPHGDHDKQGAVSAEFVADGSGKEGPYGSR